MGSALRFRTDFSALELRRLARLSKDTRQCRRLLSLAAVLDGMSRVDAVRIGGMDRQTLRDWVHRFNLAGPDGLLDSWSSGPTPRLSPKQLDELAEIVETGPDRATDGVVRWRRLDLQRVTKERFGVDYHERHVSTLLKKLGFSHMSARPRHPAQDAEIIEAYKKILADAEGAFGGSAEGKASRDMVPSYGSPPVCKKKRQSRLTLLQRIRPVYGRSSPRPQWEPLGCVPYKTTRPFDLLPPPDLTHPVEAGAQSTGTIRLRIRLGARRHRFLLASHISLSPQAASG